MYFQTNHPDFRYRDWISFPHAICPTDNFLVGQLELLIRQKKFISITRQHNILLPVCFAYFFIPTDAAFYIFMRQVKQSQPTDKSVIDVASDLTTGDDSELNKLIQSGDVSRAFQLAKAAIVAVDDDKKTRPVSQDQLLEKRRKVGIVSDHH